MMEPANNNSSGLVGQPPSYAIACAIPTDVKSIKPAENFVNSTEGESSANASPTPPPPAAFISHEPALNLPISVIGRSENAKDQSHPGTPSYRWSIGSEQPINYNSEEEFPPPPPEFMTEEEYPQIRFSYSETESDNNLKNEAINKIKHPKARRGESLSPVPASESYKSTSPDACSSAQSDSASTNLASGSDVHLRPPKDRLGKSPDKGSLKRMKPYASPMLPKDIKFKSLEVSSYDDDSAQGSYTELETDHDDVHTPLLQDGAGSPAKIASYSNLTAGTRHSMPCMLAEQRMRGYKMDTDVRLPLLKISSDPRESRTRDRLNKKEAKSDTRSVPDLYSVELSRDGSYPAEAEITVSNDDLSLSNPDIPNALHTGNAIGYAESCDSESARHVTFMNNKRNAAKGEPWRPGTTTDPESVDTMPKERKKPRLKKPFRSRSYPICIAVSFTTMLCINPPIGVVAVFLSYLSWKAYDKGDKTAGFCLARLSLYVSIAGIVTTMTLVITILYQTTIGF